jgi:hypothetical protein
MQPMHCAATWSLHVLALGNFHQLRGPAIRQNGCTNDTYINVYARAACNAAVMCYFASSNKGINVQLCEDAKFNVLWFI